MVCESESVDICQQQRLVACNCSSCNPKLAIVLGESGGFPGCQLRADRGAVAPPHTHHVRPPKQPSNPKPLTPPSRLHHHRPPSSTRTYPDSTEHHACSGLQSRISSPSVC
eukprot:4975605-Amphidinium_carterae.1